MAFCTTCGTENSDTSTFCGNCGGKIVAQSSKAMDSQPSKAMDTNSFQEEPQDQQTQPQDQQGQPQYQQPGYGYQPGAIGIRPPRTGWLTYVLVINWIGVGLAILFGILILGLAAEFESTFGAGGAFLSSIAIIIILLGLLGALLTVHLNRYSNTARIISLILQVLGFIGALGDFIVMTLVLTGLQIYALGFHKETVALFKGIQQPYGRY